MTPITQRLAGALLLLAALFALSPAHAEGTYTDAKLKAFVVAARQINRVIDEWAPKIDAAKTEAEAGAMAKEANDLLVATVEKTEGITLDEYNEIARTARTDAALSDRIRGLAKDMK
ncbi:MAG: DUF4168 domain-containing protein [Alphaproteobacteria bacterium]|nr:DUF4168 domain-containing protein [Alphaproteobacteria bacterium]